MGDGRRCNDCNLYHSCSLSIASRWAVIDSSLLFNSSLVTSDCSRLVHQIVIDLSTKQAALRHSGSGRLVTHTRIPFFLILLLQLSFEAFDHVAQRRYAFAQVRHFVSRCRYLFGIEMWCFFSNYFSRWRNLYQKILHSTLQCFLMKFYFTLSYLFQLLA